MTFLFPSSRPFPSLQHYFYHLLPSSFCLLPPLHYIIFLPFICFCLLVSPSFLPTSASPPPVLSIAISYILAFDSSFLLPSYILPLLSANVSYMLPCSFFSTFFLTFLLLFGHLTHPTDFLSLVPLSFLYFILTQGFFIFSFVLSSFSSFLSSILVCALAL